MRLALVTATSVGSVAMGLKSMNQVRSNHVPSTEPFERPPSPTNDSFSIESPNSEFSSDNLMVVFQSIQTLLVIALILFIFFVFFLWLKTKLDSVVIKDVCKFWNLQEDTAEWCIKGLGRARSAQPYPAGAALRAAPAYFFGSHPPPSGWGVRPKKYGG